MKTNCLLLLLVTFLCYGVRAQNSAYFGSSFDYYRCGNINIPGNQLTVEALIKINGTGIFVSGSPIWGDVVSKHNNPTDVNYLLRIDHCELTTSNGFFQTATTNPYMIRDSFYHIAMTYDGAMLKFYVNGCVYSQVTATGNMIQNNHITTLAQHALFPTTYTQEQFLGYMDEVRIWNVARTQTQIANNMFNIASPTTQAGLVAYYKFEGNLLNAQGNTSYNLTPVNNPTLVVQNGFSAIHPFNSSVSVTGASCNGGGTVMATASGGFPPYQYAVDGGAFQSSNTFSNLSQGNHTISVKSIGVGCSKDSIINIAYSCPTANFTVPDTVCVGTSVNIVNTSVNASSYYWNFCLADPNQTPVGLNLGNPGSLSQPVFVDIAEYNGNYYGFTVNHNPGGLVRLDFGNSLLNTPTSVFLGNPSNALNTNWGNEGIQVVNDNGNWYAIIVGGNPANGSTPRLVRINFGANLANNTPTGTNWGNIGNMLEPVDLHIFKESGNWYGFTVNAVSGTITRFNFGSSFSNTPTGTNLGNIGNLNYPTGIFVTKDGANWRAFVTNGNAAASSLSRLDFGSSLLNTPTGTNLGNFGMLITPRDINIINYCGQSVGFVVNGNSSSITRLNFSSLSSVPTATNLGNFGGFNLPHCLSKLFRVGNDLYSLVANTTGNTISRVRFTGCTSTSPSSSTLQNPPPVIYNTPGTYNINLSVDEGTATQGSFCKQIVVIGGSPPANIYNADTTIYAGASVALNHTITPGTYSWSPAAGLSCTSCSHPIASPTVSTKYYLTVTNNCGTSVDSLQINVVNQTPSSCNGFQLAAASSIYDRGYDIVTLPNNEMMLAGVTGTAGNDDILVTKMSLNGTILWSKRFGGNGAESIRKMARASDGGVLITGQTRSFGINQGEILAFKISNSGSLVWSRKFGLGSASGDLGMDIIETNDGGYAISGILNVVGGLADAVVIKLDPSANAVWSRRFNSNDGDDGVGLVQKGDTLIVAFDLQNSLANYSVGVSKLLSSNGNVIVAKKLTPSSRGLFNPYLFRNTTQPGYIISGHTIDGSSYTNMKHTVVVLNDDFDITSTRLINAPVVTNDFYTGIIPLSDGSFIGTATPQAAPDGYVYRIGANGSIMWSKKFDAATDRRLYRLSALGHEIFGIGGATINGQEQMFITNFFADGTMGAACQIDTPAITIESPAYTSTIFNWPSTTLQSFSNTIINLPSAIVTFSDTDLCQKPVFIPFPDTTVCLGNSVQLNTTTIGGTSYTWSPGTGLSNPNIANPVATPITTTQYIVTAGNDGGCNKTDTLIVNVIPLPPHSPTQTVAICSGGSVKIGSSIHPGTYVWSTGATTDSITVSITGTYWVESSQSGCMVRDSFIVTNAPTSSNIDFGYQQDMCAPKTIQFTTGISNPASFTWNFGNNQTNNTSLQPSITYTNYGSYTIKLVAQLPGSCLDSVEKTIVVGNVFDNSLVINGDTTICLGDSVLLKPNGLLSNYCWQASTGVNPTSLATWVKPSLPTNYVLTTQVLGNNLVANPDFSGGLFGINSDYASVIPNTVEGQFWVGTNPLAWNGSVSACGDHTSGTGAMMFVNGSSVLGSTVWTQTIPVTANTDYEFSTWLASLVAANPASLQFSINNINLGNSINGPANTCEWKRFSTIWNSGNNTSAVISIVNKNTVPSGNDYAIDDLYFGTVITKTDSFTVNITGLCDTIKLTGPDKICIAQDTVTYSIYTSANCSQQFSLVVDNSFADVISQTATNVKLVFKKNGTTSIKVSFNNSCKIVADSLSVTVKVSPTSISLGPDITGCRDTTALLNAGAGFETYLWQNGSTDSTFQVNTPGTYYVLAQNLCGTQFKDTLRITKFTVNPFTVSPLNATVCSGDSVQFSATGGTSYQWQPSPNFSNPNAATTKAIISASQNYTCYITDANCGRDTLITIPVIASSAAMISVSKTNDVSCGTDTAVLMASGGVSYNWSPIQHIIRNSNNQVTVNPTQNTTFYVIGTDALGCKGMDSILVTFVNSGDQQLFMPNAFSPNGDGLNEVFRPKFIGPAKKYQFSVFNRWGQLVFRSTTPGQGWDGKHQSKDQPQDVYVFYVTAEGGCNGKFEQKGTFVLIR